MATRDVRGSSGTDDIVITTYADRPEYVRDAFDMPDSWPEFMGHDAVAAALLPQVIETFPHLNVLATIGGVQVARGMAAPFALHTERRQGVLPSAGWDRVLVWTFHDVENGTEPDTVSALEITVHPEHLGGGLSHRMLAAMKQAAAAAGFAELVAPVRPNEKHRHARLPMTDYVSLTRDDCLPEDAWLRAHVRAGAVVDSVAPTSMVISGTLEEWRTWTGLPFDRPGEVNVPGALVPVLCVPEHDYAVYVEPNVWLRHRLSSGNTPNDAHRGRRGPV
jgi:GNAT superfamily N-acetyltransferase